MIDDKAVVDPAAEIDPSVEVGPFTVIGAGVRIGAGTRIGPHCFIEGNTTIGRNNRISGFVSIGAPPQDLGYKGEDTRVEIGDDNIIREYVSIHRATTKENLVTRIGSNNMLMAYVHIAHDCALADNIIMANGATLGGHVKVGERATMGGLVAVHQFTRIGSHAYIGGMSGISKDVPPYVIVSGVRNRMRVTGINRIGLKRCGFDTDTIRDLNDAFVLIFRTPDLLLKDALDRVEAEFSHRREVMYMVEFFREPSRSGVVRNGIDD